VLLTPGRAGEAAFPDVTAASPALPATVPDQIVSAVVPLHGRGDGRHEVTLELRPEHLGAIRVEVSVEQQTVHLTLHAADPATGRLLAAALPELRAALAEAGLTAGSIGVGPDGGGGTGARRPNASDETSERRPGGRGRRTDEPEPSAAVGTVRRSTTGGLDLFL
jgi:flagellar hook-length control protein FliK